MGKSSPPPAPDYTAAAQQTAAGNAQQARIAQFGSMTNQVTPYGTVSYTPTTAAYTNTNGDQITQEQFNKLSASAKAGYQPLTQWTQTVTMSPAELAMFKQNEAINQQLGNVAQSGIGYVQNAMGNPLQAQALASTPQSTANQMVKGVNLPNYQMALSDAGQIQSNIANAGDVTKGFYNPSDIATATGANQVARGFTPNNARQIQVNSGANQQATGDVYNTAGQLQTSVSNPNLLVQDTANALYNQQTQYLDPQFQQSQANLENQLANKGITAGSEAYDRAMGNFARQKQQAYESARNSAIAGGINAAQGMFGMNLQGGQFANQALGQQFGQNVTQAQLANTAANQNNQLALANQQARNAALAQQYNQGLQGTQLANQAAAQNNAQALANANFYNQALQQAYQQNLGSAGFQNQAQAQQFAQNQAAQQAQNAAQAQQFSQGLQSAEFANQAAQGMFGAAMQNAALQNQAAQTAYQQALQSGQFQNQTAAQALAQAQALQQNPINMLNAVRTGQQMQVAQMPQVGASSPAGLNQVAGPDILGAQMSQYQQNANNINAANAQNAQMWGSIIGAGGAIGAGFASDLRLKKNVIKLGTHKTLGIGLYIWDYIWGEKGAGVMAQELLQVKPEAVMVMPNGYYAVNYGAI